MSLWSPSIQAGEGNTGERCILPVPVPERSEEHRGVVLFAVPHSMMGSTGELCPFPVPHPGLVQGALGSTGEHPSALSREGMG